jgi:histone deacetylase complex regulatory component SIN3
LPRQHQITPNLDHEDSSAFLKAVKDAFQDNRENVDEFLHIHFEWKCKGVDKKKYHGKNEGAA